MGWTVTLYVLNLAFRVVLSRFLGNLVDDLDKKTKISGAFIGGVLLAAVTSLPELFTSLSSVFLVNEPEYVVGDIFGSVVFNLACLSLETLIFVKNFRKAKVSRFHILNGIFLLLRYLCSCYAFFAPESYQVRLGDINLRSVFILLIYVVSLFLQPKGENKEEETEDSVKWSVKKIVVLFVISSIALIGSSIARTYLTKEIQKLFPSLSGSIAGALLLGIGTSIPERISTAQLFHKKNYDAGIGNRIGSCTFDFAIFALADFLSWHNINNHVDAEGNFIISKRGLFIAGNDARKLTVLGLSVCALVLIFYFLKRKTKIFEKKVPSVLLTSLFALSCSVLYILTFVL